MPTLPSPPPSREPKRRRVLEWALASVAVIALVAAAVISASGDGNQTRTSGIPDVVGMAEADAVALLEDAGFDVHSVSLPRDGVPEGVVASQGEGVVGENRVNLIVSSGGTTAASPTASPTVAAIEEQPMPNVIGWSPEAVTDELELAFPYSWTVTIDVQATFKNGADGQVRRSDPKAGVSVHDGDTITVEIAYPFMPNLVGKDPNSANQLRRLGFDVRTVRRVGSPVGKIIAQEPKAGARAIPGEDAVRIIVGKAPPLTVSQENAIETAESYLRYTSFSRQGLIDQLEFEGFSLADATFAVDHISVNWSEQAVKSAKSYLRYSSFSCQGLIDQLVYEGFTYDQAAYGANQTGLCG